jgi:hypothetical protein
MQECSKEISEKMGVREKIEEMERRQVRGEECYSPLAEHLNNKGNEAVVEITDRELYKYLTEKSYIRAGDQDLKEDKQRR